MTAPLVRAVIRKHSDFHALVHNCAGRADWIRNGDLELPKIILWDDLLSQAIASGRLGSHTDPVANSDGHALCGTGSDYRRRAGRIEISAAAQHLLDDALRHNVNCFPKLHIANGFGIE